MAESAQQAAIEALGTTFADTIDALEAGTFDDIVYFGSDPDRVEALQPLLTLKGVIDIVLGGETLGRPVNVDVGRVHYDLIRWVGTTGTSAADGYAWAPATGELRAGEKVGVIGAAGPMGFMHVVRALTAGLPGVSVDAVDIDEERLAHLASVAAPLADATGPDLRGHRQQEPGAGRWLHPHRLHGAGPAAGGRHRGARRRRRHHRLLRRLRGGHHRPARPRPHAARSTSTSWAPAAP